MPMILGKNNMPKELEKLKSIIIKANPDIMKLEFGCGISGQGIHNGLIIDRVEKRTEFRVEVGDYKVEKIVRADLHTMKILGRSITLQDCVRTIIKSKKWKAMELEKQAAVFFNLCIYWNTTDDYNINTASEETIHYLYKLLK